MDSGAVPWGVEAYTDASFLLSLDATFGAGDFFWASLLIHALTKGECDVVLISTNHGPEHWECLLKKYTLDLRKRNLLHRLTIKYLVVDNGLVSEAEKNRANESCFQSEHCSWDDLKEWQTNGMILQSASASGSSSTSSSFALFIDDLNCYEAISPNCRSARIQFNSFLYALRNTHRLSTLIALGPSNACPNIEDSPGNEPTLTEVCKTLANITVTILPLSSGYSQDVHGVAHITALPMIMNKKNRNEQLQLRVLEESYTFKTISPGIVNSHLLIGSAFK
jgi:hypothetical protein